jgi:cysteinyl-tRNA synthetase
VRLHTCVPVSADLPGHLGDLRPHVLSDVIRRLLESRRVRVVACRGPLPGGDPAVSETLEGALNLRPPEHEPPADETAETAVELIAGLVERGRAHAVADGSVLLGAAPAPAASPAASGAGAATFAASSAADDGRVLWAAASGEEPAWDSPWGRGVPAPGVRCQAAARRSLGPRVDVLVAGADTPPQRGEPLLAAGHVVGSGPVRFDGAALSLRQVTEAGLDPLAVRLAYLEHHYREPVRLTWDLLRDADRTVRHWRARVAGWAESPSAPLASGHVRCVEAALDGDLDTPAALGALRDLEGDDSVPAGAKFESFLHLDQVLALDLSTEIGRTPVPVP